MESLGEYIHQINQEHADKLGIPLRTKSKETQGSTHRIEIRFVSGPMAQKMREFYLKQKPKS